MQGPHQIFSRNSNDFTPYKINYRLIKDNISLIVVLTFLDINETNKQIETLAEVGLE